MIRWSNMTRHRESLVCASGAATLPFVDLQPQSRRLEKAEQRGAECGNDLTELKTCILLVE
jgi:hypothetical protein